MHKWSKSQFEKYIKATAKDDRRIYFSDHVKKRMLTRKITYLNVLEILQQGKLTRLEPNLLTGSNECSMERYIAGKNIRVVAAVSEEDPDLIIVTAMYV